MRTIPHRCVWQKGTRACALFQPVCLVLRPPNFRQAGKQTRRGRRLGARTPAPLPRRLLRGGHHTPQQRAAEARARAPRFGTCLPCPPSPNFQSRFHISRVGSSKRSLVGSLARAGRLPRRAFCCAGHTMPLSSLWPKPAPWCPCFCGLCSCKGGPFFSLPSRPEGGGACRVATHGGQIAL